MTQDTFKRLRGLKSLSCQRNNKSGRAKEGNILRAMNEEKCMRGHFRNPLSYVSLWPRPIPLFTVLSPISFHFSGVYNVIPAEDLTSFIGSAGKMQNDHLSQKLTTPFLFFLLPSPFRSFFFFPGKVAFLCEWTQKATKDIH